VAYSKARKLTGVEISEFFIVLIGKYATQITANIDFITGFILAHFDWFRYFHGYI
jgi:hypothetical protein